MRKIIGFVLLVSLTLSVSCSTREERQARRAAEAAALEQSFVRTCIGYGHEKDTAVFRQCLSSERRIYEAEEKAEKALKKAKKADRNAMIDCTINGGSYGGGVCLGRK